MKKILYGQNVINLVEVGQNEIIKDNRVKIAQFKELSYQDIFDEFKIVFDSVWITSEIDEANLKYGQYLDSLIKEYKNKIDVEFKSHRQYFVSNDPSSFFNVEFASIRTNYYQYISGVESVDIIFRITPLRGAIQGGAFRVHVTSKITENEIGEIGCRFSGLTSQPSNKTWELDYDLEGEFSYLNTTQVRERYEFEFTYLTARQNDNNFSASSVLLEIPYSYWELMSKGFIDDEDYLNIIQNEYLDNFWEKEEFIEAKIKQSYTTQYSNPLAHQYVTDIFSGLQLEDLSTNFDKNFLVRLLSVSYLFSN